MSQRAFGRRPQTQRARAPENIPAAFQRKIAAFDEVAVEEPPPPELQPSAVDPELQEWKKSRKGFTIPWRQMSLMASLCFGAASLVLPASVNENVDYLLYALTAMSLYAGISKRWKTKV